MAMHGCQALGLLAAYGALRAKKAVARLLARCAPRFADSRGGGFWHLRSGPSQHFNVQLSSGKSHCCSSLGQHFLLAFPAIFPPTQAPAGAQALAHEDSTVRLALHSLEEIVAVAAIRIILLLSASARDFAPVIFRIPYPHSDQGE